MSNTAHSSTFCGKMRSSPRRIWMPSGPAQRNRWP
ncbi:hypothetical protein LEFCBN_LEFCBN_16035, partial [Dysosmobacter welbionis]